MKLQFFSFTVVHCVYASVLLHSTKKKRGKKGHRQEKTVSRESRRGKRTTKNRKKSENKMKHTNQSIFFSHEDILPCTATSFPRDSSEAHGVFSFALPVTIFFSKPAISLIRKTYMHLSLLWSHCGFDRSRSSVSVQTVG